MDPTTIIGQGDPAVTEAEAKHLPERALLARLDPGHVHRYNHALTRCIDCEAAGPQGTSLDDRLAEEGRTAVEPEPAKTTTRKTTRRGAR